MFSYVTLERRIPQDHPLRGIRALVDAAQNTADGGAAESQFPRDAPAIPAQAAELLDLCNDGRVGSAGDNGAGARNGSADRPIRAP